MRESKQAEDIIGALQVVAAFIVAVVLLAFVLPAKADETLPPGGQTVITCSAVGDCPVPEPDPFASHGFTHPATATINTIDACRQCHGPDLLNHMLVTKTRNCAAPEGFYPLGVESRTVDTGVFGEIEAIGSNTAPMVAGDRMACYNCHGARFQDEDEMEENNHQEGEFECVACHEGRHDDDDGHEPSGNNPGDKHCNLDLNCLDCHHPNDERLSKRCENDEDD